MAHAAFDHSSSVGAFRGGLGFASRRETTTTGVLVQQLADLGVQRAFGVSGGGIAQVYDALAAGPIQLHHFRHETGAVFAAAEAYFASQRPSVVFTTTGPGLLNALTGLVAAKWDGAKVVLLSGSTSPAQRGRWATQETSSYTFPQDALYTQGPFFDFAVRMEHAAELPVVAHRLAAGLAGPRGFIAHVSLPLAVQSSPAERLQTPLACPMVPAVAPANAKLCAEILQSGTFAIWVGFGATRAAHQVREFVDRSGARVFASPRGKGIVPENHPQYCGVTGLGGHDSVIEYMEKQKPDWVLVLGSRLGEATSFWDPALMPRVGFIHVDLDPEVAGTAYPDCRTIGVQAEVGQFLTALLEHFPALPNSKVSRFRPRIEPGPPRIAGRGPVRPQELMRSIQRQIVDASDALVMSDCGNSFVWCSHHLRFNQPGRYRLNTLFGSMGHFTAGVVGAALARAGKAVAIVGDGSMLMQSELSTAVQYGAQAVWVVLNDGGYKICQDGHQALGLTTDDLSFPQVDFVKIAEAVGAAGVVVESEDGLDAALSRAMAADVPFVVDVRIDTTLAPPLVKRFRSLMKQAKNASRGGR